MENIDLHYSLVGIIFGTNLILAAIFSALLGILLALQRIAVAMEKK